MLMQVSPFSIFFMAVSAVISIGLPVTLFVVFRKKYNAKFVPMLIGMAAFVIFTLVLERQIHILVFGNFDLKKMPVVYIVYGIFMAGIFEETARFISYNILKKKFAGIETALSYGVGHGGIESVLLSGFSMINAIVVSVIINVGAIDIITGNLQGETLEQTTALFETIVSTKPYMYLVSGIERIFAVCVQLSLSVVVFYSVFKERKIWLFPAAILVHAIVDIPAAAFQAGVISNVLIVEGITGLFAAALVFAVWKLHKAYS